MIALPNQSNLDFGQWMPVTRDELVAFLSSSRSRRVRPIDQFAEEEITLTTGPRAGRRFRLSTQPFARLWFREMMNPYWHEFCGTGPSQSGKSLTFYVIPILYYLFELGFDVIAGCTTMEMAHDKWSRDILPAIERTRYRELLPKGGAGSRGGFNGLVTFLHGVSLKWMSGGGGDKSRAYYTARVLAVTETDGYDSLETSSEAHPIDQMEARLRAESRARRILIKECTITDEAGYIWKAINKRGSASRIALQCPYCRVWGTPEREHLKGWKDVSSDIQAERKTKFHCPSCDHPWTEQDRRKANANAKLVHQGQKIYRNGRIVGQAPETRTLGFRYSAVNNLLLPASDIGIDEWEAVRSDDEINSEKKMCQFVWAMPFEMPGLDLTALDRELVEKRRLRFPKGVAPPSTRWVTVGIDVGKYRCDWVAIAWLLPERIGLILDYGEVELKILINSIKQDANDLGFSRVFHSCMGAFFFGDGGSLGLFDGWPIAESEHTIKPKVVWIDARYQGDDPDDRVVYNSLKSWRDKRILPVIGHGENQYAAGRYRQPRQKQKNVMKIGHHYDVRYEEDARLHVGHIDSDSWKAIVQQRLTKVHEEPGSLMFYDAISPTEHQKLIKELDAETRERVFEPGKGVTQKWIAHRERNHKLDATVYGCAAGHFVGFRTNPANDPRQKAQLRRRRRGVAARVPIGERKYLVTQR